jgi:hypothetical protein
LDGKNASCNSVHKMTVLERLEKQLQKLIAQHGLGQAEEMRVSKSKAYSDHEDGYWLIVNVEGCDSQSVHLGESYKEASMNVIFAYKSTASTYI